MFRRHCAQEGRRPLPSGISELLCGFQGSFKHLLHPFTKLETWGWIWPLTDLNCEWCLNQSMSLTDFRNKRLLSLGMSAGPCSLLLSLLPAWPLKAPRLCIPWLINVVIDCVMGQCVYLAFPLSRLSQSVFLSLSPFGLLLPASGPFITAEPLALAFERLPCHLYYCPCIYSAVWETHLKSERCLCYSSDTMNFFRNYNFLNVRTPDYKRTCCVLPVGMPDL